MASLGSFEPTWANERRGYIRCRAIGHAWMDYDSTWTPKFGWPLTVRCERCGMERRDTIHGSGQLLSRHYYRPVNYQLDGDVIRPSRDDFRIMLLMVRGEMPSETKTRKKAVS